MPHHERRNMLYWITWEVSKVWQWNLASLCCITIEKVYQKNLQKMSLETSSRPFWNPYEISWNGARGNKKTLQNVFKSNLNKISRGRYESEQLKRALLYKSREAVIQLFNDYSLIVSEAKYKSIHAEGLKILTPKQMLQKLPITPAQIKAGNTSENLLNEIRQIIFSLYGAKEIT